MKLSELKEQIKELYSLQEETEITVNSAEEAAEVGEKLPNAKIKIAEFKNFLKEEILEILAEEDEEISDPEGEVPAEEPNNMDMGMDMTSDSEKLDTIGDELIKLAKEAKSVGQIELAKQILNQARFAGKLEAKAEEV